MSPVESVDPPERSADMQTKPEGALQDNQFALPVGGLPLWVLAVFATILALHLAQSLLIPFGGDRNVVKRPCPFCE